MRIKRGVVLLLLLVIPFNKVYADNFELRISCPESVAPGSSFNCTLEVESSTSITNLTANYNLDGNQSSSFEFNNPTGITSGSIGTISLNIPNDAQSNHMYSVGLTSINSNNGTVADKSANVRTKSNENRLNSLTLSSGDIGFSPDTTTYRKTVDSSVSNITISAVAKDSHASVTGAGTKSLKYGLNNIEIKVTPEIGTEKVYSLAITRTDNRSNINNLSGLAITHTDINFDKDITKYNLTTTSDKVLISATREDNKSTITGDTGEKSLNYGLNKFTITVIAENTEKKVYEINITRKDVRSTNNNIKSITLSKGNLKFDKNTTKYDVEVENDVEKVKISAELDDSKSKFASGYGPREVGLKEGSNTFELRVISEKGEEKTYTINITRKDGRDSDSTLKSIKLSEGKIDFEADKLEYSINVEYSVETIKVEAKATSDKAKVTIEGDGKLSLGANTIKITVEAENGKKTVYTLIVKRKEQGYELSSNNYITSLIIKNHAIDFSSDVYKYTITTRDKKLNLSISLEDDKATYEVEGNKNLKDGSKIVIKVTAENGDKREYILNIEKPNNTIIIVIIILVTIITAGIITIVLLKRNKRIKNNKIVEENEPLNNEEIEIIEDDFSEV